MLKMRYRTIKRILDVLLIVLFSPLLLLVLCISAMLILILDGRPIFVKEPVRIGRGGKHFRMLKFRTMVVNAHDMLLNDPKLVDLKKKWEINDGKLSLDEDIRVTKIGRVLRKTDIDELPQIFNVLRGEMSLVGPRPMYSLEVERYLRDNSNDGCKIDKIQSVLPGMTGPWQVSGRNTVKFKDRVSIEFEYANTLSLRKDLEILVRTPYVVFSRKGAYE